MDVEGKASGIEVELVKLLAKNHQLPVTYAGGVGSFQDLETLRMAGKNRVDVTVGSALDLFGGTIPFETLSPFVTSGIRLGSPALTTRGLVEEDFKEIADIISTVVKNTDKDEVKKSCAERVSVLCKKYPLYDEI